MVGVAFPLLSGPAWMTWVFAGLPFGNRSVERFCIYLTGYLYTMFLFMCFPMAVSVDVAVDRVIKLCISHAFLEVPRN